MATTACSPAIPDGATFVDHTTASADVAREIEAYAKDNGKTFIDAPVSGGQAGAENGVLTVMCGGDQAVFDAAKPVHRQLRPRGHAPRRSRRRPASPRWSTRSASLACARALPRRLISANAPAST